MRIMLVAAAVFASTLVLNAQKKAPRFPAPLGVDRILTGVVSSCTKKTGRIVKLDPRCGKDAEYLLTVGDTVYRLHGYEDQLEHRVSKKTTVSGHVVQNDVTVTSIRGEK